MSDEKMIEIFYRTVTALRNYYEYSWRVVKDFYGKG